MWKKILNWFIFDWEPVSVTHAYWTFHGETYSTIVYEFQYSKARGRYRVKMYGESPKQHQMYKMVVERLTLLNYPVGKKFAQSDDGRSKSGPSDENNREHV